MKKIYIILILTMYTTCLLAQNIFVEKKQNAFNAEINYSNYTSGLMKGEFLIGYTFNGKLTPSLIIGVNNISDIIPIGDNNVISFGSNISYLILKQTKGKMPLNLSFNATYTYGLIPADYLFKDIDEYSFGADLSRVFNLGPNMKIAPLLNFKWITQIWLPPGTRGIRGSGHFEYMFEGAILYHRFYFTPSISYFSVTPNTTRLPLSKIFFNIGFGVII